MNLFAVLFLVVARCNYYMAINSASAWFLTYSHFLLAMTQFYTHSYSFLFLTLCSLDPVVVFYYHYHQYLIS